jgi:hypothetical protein
LLPALRTYILTAIHGRVGIVEVEVVVVLGVVVLGVVVLEVVVLEVVVLEVVVLEVVVLEVVVLEVVVFAVCVAGGVTVLVGPTRVVGNEGWVEAGVVEEVAPNVVAGPPRMVVCVGFVVG